MGKFQDLTGQKFGKLLVLGDSLERNASGGVIWDCECSCGNHIKCGSRDLKLGNIVQCKSCKFKDLTGKKFGNLIVLEYCGKNDNNKVMWKCKCSLCGNEIYVNAKSLARSSKDRDCGCTKNLLNKTYGRFVVIKKLGIKNKCQYWRCKCTTCGFEFDSDYSRIVRLIRKCPNCDRNIEDLTGKTFNSLYVIGLSNKTSKDKSCFWECECTHCGGHSVVSSSSLRSGHSKSCGCRNFKDLTGMKFGYLEVKERNPDRKYKRISWICECKKCGDIVVYTSGELLYGSKISCGCVNSKAEYTTKIILKKNNINFIPQKRFTDCVYKRQLPFDFYIPDINTCIELDGGQHDFPVEFFGGEKSFKLTQKRDRIKTKYCEDKGINLIRIPYMQFNNIEQILIENNVIKGEPNART